MNARRALLPSGIAMAIRLLIAQAISLGVATATSAEQEVGGAVVSGEIELGGRAISGDIYSAKWEQYRDIPKGLFGGGRFLIEDEQTRYFLRGWLDDVAEKDQEYLLEGGRYGLWGIRGGFSEIPHVYSNQARSPYFGISSGILKLPDSFDRDAFSTGGATAFQREMQGFSGSVPLEFRTQQGLAEAFLKPTHEWDLSAGYRILDKRGSRPQGLGFGSPGGPFVNIPAPIDEKIHEARADIQFARDTWNIDLGWVGSFFTNDLDSVSADNPLTFTASEGLSDIGRYALAPDNSANSLNLSGAWALPVSFPARLAGTFSWGQRRQDDDFIAMTSNSALTPDRRLRLPQDSLEAVVQTILGNLVFTARPTEKLDVEARYRIYDYDNQTDPITFMTEVINDRSIEEIERRSIANSYRKQNADLELGYRIFEATTLTAGFQWENWHRSPDREVRNLNEYSPVVRLDYRASDMLQLRGSYIYSHRSGSPYNPLAPIQAAFPASEVPDVALSTKFGGLRKYDEANRSRNQLDFLAQLTPRDDLSFTLTGGFSLSDYEETDFGLLEDNRWNAGIDVDYWPIERLGLSAFFSYDAISATQNSMRRDRTFVPPIMITGQFPWESRTRDEAYNTGAEASFVFVPQRLDGTLSYFLQQGSAKTTAKGAPGAGAESYPTISDRLQALTAMLTFHARSDLDLELGYRWEKWDGDNFQLDGLGLTNVSSLVSGVGPVTGSDDVFLHNRIADYDAHIFSLSVVFRF